MERKRTRAATQLELAQDVEHGSCGFLIARKRLEDQGVKFSSNLYAVYTRRCRIRNSGFTGLVAILHHVRGWKMRTVPDVLCLVVLGASWHPRWRSMAASDPIDYVLCGFDCRATRDWRPTHGWVLRCPILRPSAKTRDASQVSFLSIDYDVGEDQPESTLVVGLREDSDGLIRALLKQRAPGLVATDRDRIVEFSGGNSRIALVLVRSAEQGGSLAHPTDRELVRRLFQDDRLHTSDTLMRCGEVASLVIQYSVEPSEESEDPEYHHLASLADVSPGDMYRATREFLDRGVGQQRGRWRAVLPHALAA